MNSEDVEELTSIEQQLDEITKKIIIDDDDDDEIWRKISSAHTTTTTATTTKDNNNILFDFPSLPQPPDPANDGRISPEGSSSSTLSLNKMERSQDTSLKPIAFKSFQKGSYLLGSQVKAAEDDRSKPNLVQSWERLKALSIHNRPSVLQLTSPWDGSSAEEKEDKAKMFPGHRGVMDTKRSGVPVPQPSSSSSSRSFSDVKEPKVTQLTTNGYHHNHHHHHGDQYANLRIHRHHPDAGYSGAQSPPGAVFPSLGKTTSQEGNSNPPPSSRLDLLRPFRDRGASGDRSFHLGTGFSRRCPANDGGGGPIQMGLVVQKMDSSRISGPLTRATSLSKFDDDDEFRFSPPTTTSASHSVRPETGRRFAGFAVSGSSFPFPPEVSGCPTSPSSPSAFSPGLPSSSSSLLGNRNAYCFAHGGSTSSTPTPTHAGLGLTHRSSPIAVQLSSPYATMRLQTGRTKSLTRSEAGYLSPHPSSSFSISPSTRLAEDIQANEIRRLRQDLQWAKEQVALLTSRLSTNENVVQAFDQSLSSIAHRLQQLSTNVQQKKTGELTELLATVQSLRRQNLGQSSSVDSAEITFPVPDICARTSSICDEPVTDKIHYGDVHIAPINGLPRSPICRQASSDSVGSLTSSSASVFSSVSQQTASVTSAAESQQQTTKKKTVKNWLRSSFDKAFSRKKNTTSSEQRSRPGSESSALKPPVLHTNSMPSIPYSGFNNQLSVAQSTENELCHMHHQYYHHHHHHHKPFSIVSPSCNQQNAIGNTNHKHPSASNDAYLGTNQCPYPGSLSSHKMEESMSQQSGRLQFPFSCSMAANHKRCNSLDHQTKIANPNCLDVLLKDRPLKDGHRLSVCVEINSGSDIGKQGEEKAIVIGSLTVGDKTSWDALDGLVRRMFQEHLIRLDPATSLGLTGESVYNYRAGEITRWKDSKAPELLPIGYLVGDVKDLVITLRGNRERSVDLLAFETLIPKSILHRYLKLLLEQRRIILSGSTGTGKTYLAQRLAECLVARSEIEGPGADSIAVFRVDSQSSKELRQYLANMADQCQRGSDRLPVVVILDNLHQVNSMNDVFNAFVDTNYENSPYIIGTMNQASCSSTDLQQQHSFRWVLYANHMEPVRSFLGRYLRRRLASNEAKGDGFGVDVELTKIVDWLPRVWQHVNKFLETHSSCDTTIGPRLFLLCPMDVSRAQVWFTDLWNYSIVPYMLEAVREGIQTYGCRAPWEDMADWVMDTYPWTKVTRPTLLRLRQEDVGYEPKAATPGGDKTTKSDRPTETDIVTLLQEAAKQSDSDDTNNDAADLSQAEESCKSEDDSHSDLLIVDDVTASSCRTSVI